MRRLFLLLPMLAACASNPALAPAPRVNLGEEFTLGLGQGASLDGTPYHVMFQKVIEDSRCAQGMTCVWEGNAKVEIVLMKDDTGFQLELNTSPRIPTAKNGSGLVVELRRLEPLPQAGAQTEGYTATLFARKE
jgi:hypothetical protein